MQRGVSGVELLINKKKKHIREITCKQPVSNKLSPDLHVKIMHAIQNGVDNFVYNDSGKNNDIVYNGLLNIYSTLLLREIKPVLCGDCMDKCIIYN